MKNVNVKQMLLKLLFFFLGVWIIQAGVAIYLESNIGSDPFTIFTQGLADILGIMPGTANMIITFTFLVIIFFVAKHHIFIGTVLAMFTAGPFINLMMTVLRPFHLEQYNFFIRMVFVAISCVIIAIGFSLLKSTDLGVAPNDIIPFILADKAKKSYSVVRMCIDATFLILGFFLGGVVGVGTVIAALLTGPLIQFFMPKIEAVSHKIIYSEDELAERKKNAQA
ncbi:MAG: YczE/YyaS/YitT family protein [Clostridium sp.]|uniref:YczE/YyaS/YitT family protein n=1 Tax=Clostridium TaxID=1485 RepID=UPI001883A3F1|nr:MULTISPECIES: DUF6198 family protein [Clostridium]MCR6513833.1 DUF6198 family protein [Clostridium sp. LY3-2]